MTNKKIKLPQQDMFEQENEKSNFFEKGKDSNENLDMEFIEQEETDIIRWDERCTFDNSGKAINHGTKCKCNK